MKTFGCPNAAFPERRAKKIIKKISKKIIEGGK
jgi:hypothetical protein